MSLSLRSLSDDVILSRIRDLVGQERTTTIAVLDHLNEIRRRQLHLKLGYSSLFKYCTRVLGYSSSAAGRRIQTAVCLARYPEVRALIESGEASLCTIAMVSRIMTPRNKDEVLGRIRWKSQDEVKAIAAEYDPLARALRDRITPVAVRTTEPMAVALSLSSPSASSGASEPAARHPVSVTAACESENFSHSGSACPSPTARPASLEGSGDAAHPHNAASDPTPTDTRFRVQFSAGETFMAQLERFRALASHRLPPNASLEQVFALALRYFIEREDPSKRRERRERHKERKCPTADPKPASTMQNDPRPHPHRTASTARDDSRPQRQRAGNAAPGIPARGKSPERAETPARTRHIPERVRDEVFVRDRGRCTFVGSNSKRCESTHVLQIDHIQPVARGGPSTPGNLRLLCAYHNRLEAERLMGPWAGRDGPRQQQ